ncbi:helix-turn-helix domain-containing protein [Flammeovirga sp. EKP202]|uniref:helix-turn-helix domain-containing protein n=1 Tax=Flammeovirga sp. EKP202 TaxID=2770592 RepID=UPI00165ED107|nr:helix-turn-helix domain-containing protein [Flammeovirga sp. EKP202]MBD0403706.1 helix-turn-helix domain-containing protein [Flammeovirga sp. EKP202]
MSDKKSIAVLPFVNMSNDIDNEYFCDGVSEEIINALTKIDQLKVIARTSSFAFKNKEIDIREIGNQLGVNTILEGSIKKSKNKVRITAQLINVEDGIHYWSRKYDRELIDIFELEDEISLAIADEVRNNFGYFEVQSQLVTQPTNNVEAYQMFLKGRSLQLLWTRESLNEAIQYYNKAISLDKNYAKAYYANLQCYGLLGLWNYMPHEQAMQLAIQNLLMAKEIDTTLPEYPLSFVGRFFWGEWDFKNAYTHIKQVLDINPNHIDGLEAMAELFLALGFFEEADIFANRLLEVDPLSANNHYTLAHIYYYRGLYKKALERVNYALTLNSTFELAHHLKCYCLIWLNDRQAFDAFIQNTSLGREKNLLFQLINGRKFEISETDLNQLKQGYKEALIVPYDLFILSQTAHKDLAFSRLEEMILQKRGQIINYRQDPFLKPLHTIPGFKELHVSNLSHDDIKEIQGAENKLTTSILNQDEIENLKKDLLIYFNENKPYLNPELSLKFVAEALELNTNKTSFLINQAFNSNFNDFVNLYRLKHFKSIALDPENVHLTILGLAYNSGFNSKTVFNTFFKKSEGTTPSRWIKSHSVSTN